MILDCGLLFLELFLGILGDLDLKCIFPESVCVYIWLGLRERPQWFEFYLAKKVVWILTPNVCQGRLVASGSKGNLFCPQPRAKVLPYPSGESRVGGFLFLPSKGVTLGILAFSPPSPSPHDCPLLNSGSSACWLLFLSSKTFPYFSVTSAEHWNF